ncbi:hypothetical protein TNCV_4593291 [Trichonephila clavipes]|uniref:Uncharacterized protein n=1 Tax=Trichonephila clavipes TaxID=2585209 RepID=A0A8X7BKE8_TRICX|nr:hypothetical protein TNCV_4593291 [Trichonephila clavipes]
MQFLHGTEILLIRDFLSSGGGNFSLRPEFRSLKIFDKEQGLAGQCALCCLRRNGNGKVNGTGRRKSNFELYQSYKDSGTVRTSSKYNELNGQVTLLEWTKTALLKKSSMPNQLAHEERVGQILEGWMAYEKIT